MARMKNKITKPKGVPMFYQQGDVLLFPVNEVKGKIAKKTARGFVLADGEVTGHMHTVQDEIEMLVSEAGMFVSATEPFTVTHEEHKPITVPAGKYEVRRVQEYNHFQEEARNVID